MNLPEPCLSPLRTSMNLIKSETATTGNSDGNNIGLCINCEHALLEHTSETCKSCHSENGIFKNFVKAEGIPESKMCASCSNNVKIPRAKGVLLEAGKNGFPCSVCANEYFYSSL